MTNADAKQFAYLKKLKSFELSKSTVTDFGFLCQLPELRVVEIHSKVMDDATLSEFVIPEKLRQLSLSLLKQNVSEEAVERFRESAPVDCEVVIHRD